MIYSIGQINHALSQVEELDDEMPDEMWATLVKLVQTGDRDGCSEFFRTLVRMTKSEFLEKLTIGGPQNG